MVSPARRRSWYSAARMWPSSKASSSSIDRVARAGVSSLLDAGIERTLQVTERIIAASQKKIERAVNKRRTRKTVVPPANADESATEASAPAS